ncbi:hypothetical protein JTE90_012352 [Oedothorax gibbosus]|uniref:Uncharacterized protein n=1 Tax=Oedothorax gibbosus TaxID=931172 RepID=A0AAV6V4I6_9ARAC|nr:hypothetical protein JTE90_012352 [Oedothorax gibbosus]
MLVIPQEVRWNTYFDTIKSYLDNRGKLVQVCQDHQNEIGKDIFKLVNDVNLTVNCADYLAVLKPIAKALDSMQSDNTKLAESVDFWNKLGETLESCSASDQTKVMKYFNARRGAHYAANLLDHRYCGKTLCDAQRKKVLFISCNQSEILPLAMQFLAKRAPFPSYMFESQFNDVDPITWWANIELTPRQRLSIFHKNCSLDPLLQPD